MIKQRHIYKMGIIGNCAYLAYIDHLANVQWMCMPRFDSSFIFGGLLDDQVGGTFSIMPAESDYKSQQYYLKNTNVLVTEFFNKSWRFRVIDFAPRFYQDDRYFRPLMLARKIELIQGNPLIRIKCTPMGNYGQFRPSIVQGSNHLRFLELGSQARLTTDVPLSYILENKQFVLTKTHYLVFTYGVPLEASLPDTVERFLEKTIEYWNQWIKATNIPSIFQDQVIRSALILKLHQFEDTGAIIAAGTTSLPEHMNSGRNWDYRYCWMRDSYYTLTALNNTGHFEELENYFNYIQNIILTEKKRLKPLYTITGDPVKKVECLNLKGYMDNQPVRIGNDAVLQAQNDVYGQILISLLPLFIDKRLNYYGREKTLLITKLLLNGIEKTIDEPDSGIWEFGEIIEQHSYTALFQWAGSSAALKIATMLDDSKVCAQAKKLIQKSSTIIENCYHAGKKAYAQSVNTDHLDASGLQLILMDYLDPQSTRAKEHLIALEKELLTKDGLIYRYVREDAIGAPKVSFLICAFWYAETLACLGRLDESYQLLEKLVTYSNHLGLFSEDADSNKGQWGNFAQTYTHVGLINAVYRLEHHLDRPIFLA